MWLRHATICSLTGQRPREIIPSAFLGTSALSLVPGASFPYRLFISAFGSPLEAKVRFPKGDVSHETPRRLPGSRIPIVSSFHGRSNLGKQPGLCPSAAAGEFQRCVTEQCWRVEWCCSGADRDRHEGLCSPVVEFDGAG